MAHYPVYVLVAEGTNSVENKVHELMAPYSIDFPVEECEAQCDCNRNRDGYDPDCEECGGTGRYLTTFNPMWKFEEYMMVEGADELREAAKNPCELGDETAMAPLCSLDIEKLELPCAIVTPPGDWWEMEEDWYDKDLDPAAWEEWRTDVKDLFDAYPTAILVVVDCHQ